jgi:hypothetical protein
MQRIKSLGHHKKKQQTANIGLAIWRLKYFYETFVQGTTLGIILNFYAKNPPHRQAENRHMLIFLNLIVHFPIFLAITSYFTASIP